MAFQNFYNLSGSGFFDFESLIEHLSKVAFPLRLVVSDISQKF